MEMDGTGRQDGESALMQRLREEHSRCSQKLEMLVHKPYLSDEEKLEETRLKKTKLYLKDRMRELPRGSEQRSTQQVSATV